jgi:hypothetical protein
MEMRHRKSMKTERKMFAQIRDKRNGNEKKRRRKIMKRRISRENSVKKRK